MAGEEKKDEVTTTTTTTTTAVVPPTEMIYYKYDGSFELECDSKIVGIEQKQDEAANDSSNAVVVEVALDRTVMHAQGGGQPTDIGAISVVVGGENEKVSATIKIDKVVMNRETGVAIHRGTIDKDSCSKGGLPTIGTMVHVSVDANTRRLNSECHSAGHVVDRAMANIGKSMKPTKGYHYLDGPYVEYEGTIPPEERPQVLKELQQAFKDLVAEDIVTKIETLPEDEATEVCNRMAKNFDMKDFGGGKENEPIDIRVVTVAGFPGPCGGTHIKSTGDLKERNWGIIGLKSKKGVVRVRYGQEVA